MPAIHYKHEAAFNKRGGAIPAELAWLMSELGRAQLCEFDHHAAFAVTST
jgi:hypothetical protein